MDVSLYLWIVFAVLVFWGVGLYNRVMRIRARGLDAFGSLEKYLRTLSTLLQIHMTAGAQEQALAAASPSEVSTEPRHMAQLNASDPDIPAHWSPLVAQVLEMEAAYKIARTTPLAQPPLTSLANAIAAVQTEWQHLRDEPADLAGSPVPDSMRQQWDEAWVKLQSARDAFNQIMARYNEALDQFPARLVVAVMGFQRAAVL